MDKRIFEAEIKDRMEVVKRIYEKIKKRRESFKHSVEGVESMALQLHNLYGAYEEVMKLVAEYFENQIEPPMYHKNLLRRMKLEIEGVRPALLSQETFSLLDELRRFYHFLRHAYGVELRAEKVEEMVEIAIKVEPLFLKDLERFISLL